MIKKFTLLLLAMLCIAGTSKATEIWTGSCTIGNWAGSTVTVEKAAFASATAGNIIKVTFSAYAETESDGITPVTCWQYNLGKEQDEWKALTDFSGGDLTKGQKSASYTLTETNVSELKQYGLAVNGRYITVTKVELLTVTSTESIWTGSITTENWGKTGGTDMLALSYGDKGKLSESQKNDYIKVTYTVTDAGAQVAIQNPAGWGNLSAKDDNTYVAEGDNTGKTLVYTIDDATTLEAVQLNGILVRGKNITITAVDLLKASNRYDVVPLAIGADGIATFSSSKHLDFTSTGVTPYYASSVGTGIVTLTAATKTKKWAGYIVQGAAGSYEIPVIDGDEEWQDAFNNLRAMNEYPGAVYRSVYSDYSGGGDDETNIKTKYRYIFAKHGDNIGFYLLPTNYEENSNPYHTLAAHKAYLETATNVSPDPNEAPALNLIFGGEGEGTTAINTVSKNPVVEDGVYYNLQGVAVKNPSKGLYILNGKKVIVK